MSRQGKRLHKRACTLLGVDPSKVRLVGPTEFRAITHVGVGKSFGVANYAHRLVYVRRTAGYDTYVHEVLHHLFQSKPHWWIFSAAFKLSGLLHGEKRKGYWYVYGRAISPSEGRRIKERIGMNASGTSRPLDKWPATKPACLLGSLQRAHRVGSELPPPGLRTKPGALLSQIAI